MSTDVKKQTLGFQTEVQQLLDLMVHSLYSNREIFLRELISNASDAADKLRFEALQDDSLFEADPELKIRIEYDKTKKTITVADNGIGMSREEIIQNLGTIAKSGTREFFEKLTGDQNKDSQLIGQFGVGFYSSFIVAEKVEVLTRRAGLPQDEGVRWISDGRGEYTVETIKRAARGTTVILHLREDAAEFLDGYRLRSIIKRYSDHISLPILMPEQGDDAGGDERVNNSTALWLRNKKDITEEEYTEFYKHIAHDFEEPLARIHTRVEGKLEYAGLLFIPSRAPFDLWDREHRHGVKLYVRRVFIMDDADQLLPTYLRFVRGIVDSDDLPLNISREILQQNRTIESIRSGITRKVLDLLAGMADNEPEKYGKFWKEFGRVLKEGVIDDPDKKEDLARLFRFASTHEDSDEQTVSLQDYVSRMKEGQKEIFYIIAENVMMARNSPHLEVFREKGIEVLLMTDPIDEWVTAHLPEFDGKNLKSVTKGELDLGEPDQDGKAGKKKKAGEKQEQLVKLIKDNLGDRVKDVRITDRLTTSPACLVAEDHEMGRYLQQILKASGQQLPEVKPILEINPEHPLIEMLQEKAGENEMEDWSHILFDQALLSEGGKPEDPAGFVKRLNTVFMALGRTRVQA